MTEAQLDQGKNETPIDMADQLRSELEARERQRQSQRMDEFVALVEQVARGKQVKPEQFESLGKTADQVVAAIAHVRDRLNLKSQLSETYDAWKAGDEARSELAKLEAKLQAELQKVRKKYASKIATARSKVESGSRAKSRWRDIERQLDLECRHPSLDRDEAQRHLRELSEQERVLGNRLHRPTSLYTLSTDANLTALDPAFLEQVNHNRNIQLELDEVRDQLATAEQVLLELARLRAASVY